ncbi:hypothetical protein [Lysinibacillus xylanilyticus]|uniref:hypothetical protein n=1 Tax=Lysinibacillus xylanilyticus TaxID=582475 RepID=UPI00083C9851|nr:hypothetical protein [Lysinibacillus xylanilyticus]
MSRLGQKDVGHEGVITGRDAFSLRSSTCSLQGLICDANPQGVAKSPLQSTNIQGIYFKKCHPQLLMMSQKRPDLEGFKNIILELSIESII